MSVIVLLIIAGGLVAGGFLAAFAWAVRTGQFDDTSTPPVRILLDEPGRTVAATPPKDSRHVIAR
jgi:cbb3-type cytochrome oxidase maturation protein